MSYEESQQLQTWVTATALQNRRYEYFDERVQPELRPSCTGSYADDAKNDPGDGSYVPIQMREYVDEAMKFLIGNLQETTTTSGSGKGDKPLSSFVSFNAQDFMGAMTGPQQPDQALVQVLQIFGPVYGSRCPGLMVPRSYVPMTEMIQGSTRLATSTRFLAWLLTQTKPFCYC